VGDKAGQYWFEQPDSKRRLYVPRMFKILSMVRRLSVPQIKRELGLSDFEWRVMSQVGDREPMSLNELAAASRHDKGQLSRGVKRLVEAGLLVRESRRGERGVFISHTPEGRKVFEQLKHLAFSQNEAVVRGVTPEELEVFNAVLDKLEANAHDMMETELGCRGAPAEAEPAPAGPAKARKLAGAR
jgi:DNA-binding MarR family transcriptional regulator